MIRCHMKSKRLGGTAVLLGAMMAGAWAHAKTEHRAYLSLAGGYSAPAGDAQASDPPFFPAEFTVEMDNGFAGSAAVGAYVHSFRFEFQYTAQANDVTLVPFTGVEEEGDFHANLFMLNAYWDIPVADRTKIYLGAGGGVAYCEVDNQSDFLTVPLQDASGSAFAYQVMIGLAYEITPQFAITAGYRGWTTGDIDVDDGSLDLPWMNLFEAGLRFSL